eukprot:TRINITY_DN17135_c0_g1_i1.p1 TRINITY_DN17135_c0_g1~~TRINITY_DN17135_c0_g1_i1.p1  ORF type:complete len:170 (-),score=68.84 TRINITY_DN17135_c0_g1_i1:5-514(-)
MKESQGPDDLKKASILERLKTVDSFLASLTVATADDEEGSSPALGAGAPPPPPPPMAPPPPPISSASSLLKITRSSTPQPTLPKVEEGRGSLLSQIKLGTSLRKLDQEKVQAEKEELGSTDLFASLQDTMRMAMDIRKKAMEAQDSDDDDDYCDSDDEDWSDDEYEDDY